MRKREFNAGPGAASICVAITIMTAGAPANAQALRTWVSSAGNDANACTPTAPCSTFQGAIQKTMAGGEINCLNSGEYGTLSITKSITISCVAGTGGVTGGGIVVNTLPTDEVFLKGLDISGGPSNQYGIFMEQGMLHIEKCLISGFGGGGIIINNAPQFAEARARVDIVDTTVTHNSGAGIRFIAFGAANRLAISRSVVSNNGFNPGSNGRTDGVSIEVAPSPSGIKVSISHTESINNAGAGYAVYALTGGTAEIMLDSSRSYDNAAGILANGSGGVVRFTRSNISANTTGVVMSNGGSALSYGTNSVDGNGSPGSWGTIGQE
jgi:hypothetical protein